MGSIKIPFFRIWYSTAFVTLFLFTFGLTLIPPGDIVYQLIRKRQIGNIFSVGGVYLVTALVWVFLWSKRIYANRLFLRDIPRGYIPIEHGDVPRRVRRLIEKQWMRSAVVAWDSRPRDVSEEVGEEYGAHARHRRLFHLRKYVKHSVVIPARTASTVWGPISHLGWEIHNNLSTTPGTIQYSSVIQELPNLLEAKAVSLAPLTGPQSTPDANLVSILQRPPGTGLRDYVTYLLSIGILEPSDQIEDFITQYEVARFSAQALTETQFSNLTMSFSDLLSFMSLDVDRMTMLVDELDEENSSEINYPPDSSSDQSTTGSIRRPNPSSPFAHSQSATMRSPRLSSDT